mmetsp:Transcript_69017/g.150847  ORF Transcript_69017/g.150847 Transcript_69017/m.150847 type:complete len:194 (+) Transcript_69017:380-961(+)
MGQAAVAQMCCVGRTRLSAADKLAIRAQAENRNPEIHHENWESDDEDHKRSKKDLHFDTASASTGSPEDISHKPSEDGVSVPISTSAPVLPISDPRRKSVSDWYNDESSGDEEEHTQEGLQKTLSEWFLNGQKRPSNRSPHTDVYSMDKEDTWEVESQATTINLAAGGQAPAPASPEPAQQDPKRKSLGDWYG